MILMSLYNYLARSYEKMFKRKSGEVKEPSYFQKVKSDWDWYNVPGSLFGIEYFISPNPMTKKDKEDFTNSLSEIITSNFEVMYNSLGMVLINKNIGGLEAIANAFRY